MDGVIKIKRWKTKWKQETIIKEVCINTDADRMIDMSGAVRAFSDLGTHPCKFYSPEML